jgi:hypothetical protein
MKYLVRLNPKAMNPLTGKVIVSRVWEVEQCAYKDSEKVIWHCANVKIGDQDIRQVVGQRTMLDAEKILAAERSAGATGLKFELAFDGICFRGQDNAIIIDERGSHEVS